jgi:hypothetical protein
MKKLNEWDFAVSVLKQIGDNRLASFDIIRRDSIIPEYHFAGIVRDSQGKVYDITEDENIQLFNQMMQAHALNIMDDFANKKLVLGIGLGDEFFEVEEGEEF